MTRPTRRRANRWAAWSKGGIVDDEVTVEIIEEAPPPKPHTPKPAKTGEARKEKTEPAPAKTSPARPKTRRAWIRLRSWRP